MRDPYQDLRSELVAAAARVDVKAAPERRRWWQGRSRPLAVVLAALVICGSAAAAVLSLTANSSQPLAGQVPGRIASASQHGSPSVAGFKYTISVFPALNAEQEGWAASISYSNPKTGLSGGGQGGGGGYPTPTDPIFEGTGPVFTEPAVRGDTVAFVVTGPAVAAVRIGVRTIRTFTSPQLPTGDRAAVFFVPAGSPQPEFGLPGGGSIQYLKFPGPHGGHRVAVEVVQPLDKAGHVIPTRLPPTSALRGRMGNRLYSGTSFWQAPSAVTPNIHEPPYHGPTHPRPGACELAQHALPGLTPEWGHTLNRITPVTDSVGELFLSCVDTEYYFRGTPLDVGVLLDARRPGLTLDGVPGAQPVLGNQNLVDYNAAGLSAKRVGNAWVVVQGGSKAQRLKVLQALRITKLTLPQNPTRSRS